MLYTNQPSKNEEGDGGYRSLFRHGHDFILPVGDLIVFQKLTPNVGSGIDSVNDGIEDAGGAVDDIEGRVESLFDGLASGDFVGIFVGYPAGIDAIHMDAVGVVVGGGGAGHHIESGLGHVGMGVAGGFGVAIELAFDGGDIDDVLVAVGGAEHEGLEAGVEDKRGDGVDELDFE